jgi:RNA polymerase primary sigma factor
VFQSIREFILAKGREPTLKELSKYMKINEAKLKEALEVAKIPISLEYKIGSDGTNTLLDTLPDMKLNYYTDKVDNADISRNIKVILKTLSPREEKILRIKFGISD